MEKSIEQYANELYDVLKEKNKNAYVKKFLSVCMELETEEKISELIYIFNKLPEVAGSKCIFVYHSRGINCNGVACRSCHKKMPERVIRTFNKPPKEYRR